ncbi:MAG: hypothetical protein NTX45_15310 [Proteobacteria bacterium]|nr:hypothetical protein [Pseudomonadota bacterium]
MSIIRIINGREVIPVWAIPYVCHLGVSLSAGFGDFLQSLAHKPSGMIKPDFITAYLQDENGAVVPISNNEWKGLLKDVKNEEDMRMESEGPLNIPYYAWRESSAIITPTQAFLYVDELSRWYYEAHKAYIDHDKNIWVIIDGKHEPIPYRREDYPLILDPIIPKKVLKKHCEWFEACNFQGQGGASPEPEQATGGTLDSNQYEEISDNQNNGISNTAIEKACEAWLCELMIDDMLKGTTKAYYRAKAKEKWPNLGTRAFGRAWANAASKSPKGQSWVSPGAKSKQQS